MIQVDDIHVRENLTMETSPMRIEDREMKQSCGKEVVLMKVVGGLVGERITWDMTSHMRESYLNLFPLSNFRSQFFF